MVDTSWHARGVCFCIVGGTRAAKRRKRQSVYSDCAPALGIPQPTTTIKFYRTEQSVDSRNQYHSRPPTQGDSTDPQRMCRTNILYHLRPPPKVILQIHRQSVES